MSKEHWECDEWQDDPATGDNRFGEIKGAFGATKILAMHAAGSAPAAKKETLFEKIAHFIAHPIKTLRGEKVSGMHGAPLASEFMGLPSRSATLASEKDQPSFFQGVPRATPFGVAPGHASKADWWESKLGDRMEWDRK